MAMTGMAGGPSYLNGMGFGVGTMPAQSPYTQGQTAIGAGGVQGSNLSIAGSSAVSGSGALLLILGGFIVLYVGTRKIQGSR